MSFLADKIRDEPVIFSELIRSAFFLAMVFGVALTGEQVAAVTVFFGALVAVFARSKVSPVANESVSDGFEDLDEFNFFELSDEAFLDSLEGSDD